MGELHRAHPEEQGNLQERETGALGDLAIIVGFIQDLAPAIAMPSFSNNKRQAFVSRSEALEKKLNDLKNLIDLRDFVVLIDNLLEPGVAEGALKALDEFTIEMAGTKMGFLYDDLIEDSLSDLASQYEQIKAKMEQSLKYEPPKPALPTKSTELRVQQRRQKGKTRPTHSSIYESVRATETSGKEGTAPPTQTFKIDPSTAGVFTRLFAKSQARGSVGWESFGTAMAKLGFSVLPRYGSVCTFFQPDNMTVRKLFIIHRPHQSRIEGYRTLISARRLKRMYGWNERTFQVN